MDMSNVLNVSPSVIQLGLSESCLNRIAELNYRLVPDDNSCISITQTVRRRSGELVDVGVFIDGSRKVFIGLPNEVRELVSRLDNAGVFTSKENR